MTITISAQEVNKLRLMTGAGMMDCKKALVESEGDIEKAIDYLRKKGQKLAVNRAGREASEGLIIAKTSADNKKAVMITLNCETDFVAKNADFADFANKVADFVLVNDFKSVDELKQTEIDNRKIADHITDLIGKIGEKIDLTNYSFISADFVYAYNHQGNKLGSIVGFNKNIAGIDVIGKDVAMQIAAMNPVAIDKSGVDQATIDRELEIGKDQARQEGKPEEMLDKIAQGKLNKFFKESTLISQEFIKDSSKTVEQYLTGADKDLKISAFFRFQLGR